MISRLFAFCLAALPAMAGLTVSSHTAWSGHTCDAYVTYTVLCTGVETQQSGTSSFSNGDAYAMLSADPSYLFHAWAPNGLVAQVDVYAGSGVTRTLLPGEHYSSVFQFDSATADGTLDFSDDLAILAPISSGTLRFEVYTTGGGDPGAGGSATFSALDGGTVSTTSQVDYVDAPFTAGQPVHWEAQVSAGAGDYAPNDPNTGASQAFARFDLRGVQLLDAQGAPVTGWSYRSASNWQYNAVGGEMVPEPGSMALAGLAGAVLVGWRKRGKQRGGTCVPPRVKGPA